MKFLEGNLHAFQASNDDNMKCLESWLTDESKEHTDSIKPLEQFLIQEIQALKDDMVTTLQSLEDSPFETSDSEALATRPPGNERGIVTRRLGDLKASITKASRWDHHLSVGTYTDERPERNKARYCGL